VTVDEERNDPGLRRPLRRRSILAGAAGLTGGGLLFGSTFGLIPSATVLADVLGSAASTVPDQGITTVERVFSRARRREVDLVTMLPAAMLGAPAVRLPVCLFLHGLDGDARHAVPAGLGGQLVAAVARKAIPPFAFVALDGGNNYWHDNQRGDHSMSMLLDEVPRWLFERGLGDATGMPFACAGVSMGGFGALVYGRRRNERGNPARALGAISPGLLTSWREMSTRKAFRDPAEWAAIDPLRHVDKLGAVPVGIWCGTEDHFIEGARKFIGLAGPEVGYTGPGTHAEAFFRQVAPDMLAFLGRHVPTGATAPGANPSTR